MQGDSRRRPRCRRARVESSLPDNELRARFAGDLDDNSVDANKSGHPKISLDSQK